MMLRLFLLHVNRPKHNGCHRQGGARFLLGVMAALGLLMAYATPADELDDLLLYAKAGAPHLAIQLVAQRQPDLGSAPQQWERWERALVGLMRDHQQWQALDERLRKAPIEPPPAAMRRWLVIQHAEALFNLHRSQEARALLTSMLWGDSEAETQTIARGRHLIIQSYLQEGRDDDAYDAMLRYRQDYGDGDRDAFLLRAEVLLRNGRPGDARAQLSHLGEDGEAVALRLLAALRMEERTKEIVRDAQRRLKEGASSLRVRLMLWGVVAEGSEQLGDQAARAIALEQFYAEPGHTMLAAGLFSFTADSLWDAYAAYGIEVGNREQMLLGDDAAWFKAAEAAVRQYPIRARSLYTVMAERAASEEGRLNAHRALLGQWGGKERNPALITALYLESKRFGNGSQLPIPVRYFLYDAALAQGDLPLASRMLQGLQRAPGEVASFDWQLRGAKVLVLAGEHERAFLALQGLLAATPALSEEQFDRLMQVVFDLQTVGEHEHAVILFTQLALRVEEPQTRRELLYWIGDSRFAQQRYVEAGRYYLQSAILPGVSTMDPWAETARYQAAKALALGGLVDDARLLYQQLLDITTDPPRGAVLQHELEQLRLLAHK